MILSLPRQELFEYVNAQTNSYYPDKCTLGGDKSAFNLALERLEYCFKHIRIKGYQDKGQAKFYHLHMDQYSAFLYYYANSILKLGKLESYKTFADKLILLNRALSGMWFSYNNNLPDIFVFSHPVGTVLGNANYSDYLYVSQNVTINTIEDTKGDFLLNIGKGCFLSTGAKIIGNSNIGDWCTIGVDTVLHNRSLPDNYLAFTNFDGNLTIKKHDNGHIINDIFIR